MAVKVKGKSEGGKSGDTEIKFTCRLCGKEKPIHEMRTVNRFVPALIACQDCARKLR